MRTNPDAGRYSFTVEGAQDTYTAYDSRDDARAAMLATPADPWTKKGYRNLYRNRADWTVEILESVSICRCPACTRWEFVKQ